MQIGFNWKYFSNMSKETILLCLLHVNSKVLLSLSNSDKTSTFQYFSVTVFLMLNMLTVHNDVYDMTIIHPYPDSCWKFIKKK